MRYPIVCLGLLLLFFILPASALFSGDIILARGDSIEIPIGTKPGTAWIFSDFGAGHVYDDEWNVIQNLGTRDMTLTSYEQNPDEWFEMYYYNLTEPVSYSFVQGKYTIYIQRFGKNTIKEVSYKTGFLVSPYKEVPNVDVAGLQVPMVKDLFVKMVGEHSDDVLEKLTMDVQTPQLSINQLDQINNSAIYIQGRTNLKTGTPVKILWDADNLVSELDYKNNTYYSKTFSSDLTQYRTWSGEYIVNIQDLAAGKDHFVEAYAGELISRVPFTIYSNIKGQKLTFKSIKYLDTGVIVTPTPERIVETVIEYKDKFVYLTPTPTPVMTNALGEVYDPFIKPDITGTIVPIAFCGVALIVLRRYKWK